jgi:hypothetical protein
LGPTQVQLRRVTNLNLDVPRLHRVEQMKGSMGQENCPDPSAFERGNYMKALQNYAGEPI